MAVPEGRQQAVEDDYRRISQHMLNTIRISSSERRVYRLSLEERDLAIEQMKRGSDYDLIVPLDRPFRA